MSHSNRKNDLTTVSLFSGCGGLDLGFEKVGFVGKLAVDNDEAAVSVYNNNIRNVARVMDVTDESFLPSLGSVGRVDVVLGGFPCQGFSKAGPKRESDSRNLLYRQMLQAVGKLKPRMFVAENVDGMSQNFKGKFVQQIQDDFAALGYSVSHRILDAANFGLPQHRRRIFFIGTNDGCNFSWPSPTHDVGSRNGDFKVKNLPLFDLQEGEIEDSPATVRDAIGDLIGLDADIADHVITGKWPAYYENVFQAIGPGQKLCNVRHSETSVYTWEIPAAFGKTNAKERKVLETIARNRRHKQYGDIPNGNPLSVATIEELSGLRNVFELAASLESKGYLKRVGDGFDLKGAMFCSGLFKRPAWDAPAPTVLTNLHNPRYFLHPSEDRPFSLREAARLQGFPDTFEFCTNTNVKLTDGYRLVGNAVPPPLAQAIAMSVRNHLVQRKRTTQPKKMVTA